LIIYNITGAEPVETLIS